MSLRLRKASLTGDAWWSAQWLKALASFTRPRALERGHKSATAGEVQSLHVEDGFAEALVKGSGIRPCKVEIGLPMSSQTQAKRASDALTTKAFIVAKLLAGELPHEVAALFAKVAAPLFPTSNADLSGVCSCTDDDAPCKHVAAVYYILGQEFDRDPFLLLEMRGLGRAQLLAEIQLRRSAGKRDVKSKTSKPGALEFPAQTLLSGHLHNFYDAPKNQPLTWDRAPGLLDSLPPSGSRIKELGSPPFWQSDYDFQEILKAIYLAVRAKLFP